MHLLILLLTSCAPQDAEITGSYHAWLARGSSPTVLEDNLSLADATVIDCRDIDEAEREPGWVCNWGELANPVDNSLDEPDNPAFRWLRDDTFYLKQGVVEPTRVEALLTSEGDFQLTVHHDLGDREVLRYVFVIDPNYNPTVCAPAGATCFSADGEGTDDDGDGWVDFNDPDCLDNSYEIGFTDVACNDGVDNDGDGQIDGDDADCGHALDDSEGDGDGTCRDGTDNDGDGWSDFNDPDCDLFDSENGESNSAYACTDGVDNDGDGDVDGDDAQCGAARDNDEGGVTDDSFCNDDFDADGDGWLDDADPDCDLYSAEAGLGFTACNDGLDNDGDGLVDADDPGCLLALDPLELDPTDTSCADGDDNDGDGYTDVDDPDCLLGIAESGGWAISQCNDGVDNDGDGDIDDEDRQCVSAFDDAEESLGSGTCRDSAGADDDGDGWVNELDPDCALGSNEVGLSSLPCNDGVDNDGDGDIDADDVGCISPMRHSEAIDPSTDCADGVDNDGDGYADALDQGCMIGDFEDAVAVTECADGADNDGDGLTDADDPDCHSAADIQEATDNTCADGIDNDGDGWVDNIDPECASLGFERGFASGHCADGIDNDGDGLVDGDDDGCTNPSDPWEVEVDECTDGADNDGDGWSDANDPDCFLRSSAAEDGTYAAVSACNDGQDNDGDGLVDAADADCRYALDNTEATDVGGEGVNFPLDTFDTLTQWAEDEDGSRIYYLNAGAYQINPSDSEDFWVLPQEWLAGYATAKFAAEEFDALPNDFYFLGFDINDPPGDDEYAEAVQPYVDAAAVWSAEPETYGFMELPGGVGPYEIKVEDNAWRPLDRTEPGLDNWVELHSSWVRIEEGAVFEKGASFSGDYQIYLTGRDAASQLVLRGSFQVNNVREDIWGYDVLEDELEAQRAEDGFEVSTCD